MTLIIIGLIVYAVCRASASVNNRRKEELRKAEEDRMKLEQARMHEEWKARVAEAKIETDRMIKIEREQMRQAKEMERQAEQLARHEERLEKLEQRLTIAEGEIAFNREQRERLFKLLEIEQKEQEGTTEGSREWAKSQKKIISLENQIHTVQKRIDKSKMEKVFCESRISA